MTTSVRFSLASSSPATSSNLMPSADLTYTLALDLPMLNIMELPPPPIFCDIDCPSATKMMMGSTQARMLTSVDVCSISSPVVETPASSRRCTKPSSGTIAVL